MRELVYFVATSLDGYIAGPRGEVEGFPMEGDHMAEIITRYTDSLPTAATRMLGVEPPGEMFGTVLMGWRTYEVGLAQGVASPYEHLEQIVFSRTHEAQPGDVRVTDENPIDVVRAHKRQDGAAIWLCGGGNLAGQLLPEIDRLIIKRNPVVFGSGVPLFGEAAYIPRRFQRIASREFESGVDIVEYVPER